jgi:CspA family cold shock protein
VHHSSVLFAGYRALQPGREIELDHETSGPDGYAYRAVRVWPAGAEPVEPSAGPPGAAYSSTLTPTFDEDRERR